MSEPSTRTLYRFTPRPGGGPSTSPLVTSKTPPCQGQVTSTPLSSPSDSGPPACVHVLSIAWNEPSTLKSAISVPLTSTIRACPAGMSSVLATFTNSGIAQPPGLLCSVSVKLTNNLRQRTNLWRKCSSPLPAGKLSQKPTHWIVEVIHDALLQRNDRVVGNVNIFGANFRTAFGDIAEANPEFVLQQFGARQTVEWVHFQPGHAHEEARSAKLVLLLVIAQYVTNVLAEKALNAFAKFLHAIDLALIHLPFNVRLRRKR